MNRTPATDRGRMGAVDIARAAVGLIWLAGAAVNAVVTLRMADPYGWLADGSRVRGYRWFFREVAGAHPTGWTLVLIAGEAALGVLTLSRGGWAKLGLAAGAMFSAVLASFSTPFTVVMGPYALLLAWLARHDGRPDRPSPIGRLAGALFRHGADHGAAPA